MQSHRSGKRAWRTPVTDLQVMDEGVGRLTERSTANWLRMGTSKTRRRRDLGLGRHHPVHRDVLEMADDGLTWGSQPALVGGPRSSPP